MANIRKLVGKIPDINQGNRYKIVLTLPEKLNSEYGDKVDKITFYCQKCTFPGFSISQIDSRIYGEKKKLGGIRNSDLTANTSLLFDYKAENINFLEKWSELIMNSETKRLGYYEDYIGRMYIEVLNNLNKIIVIADLKEVYPIRVNDVNLGYDNTGILPIEIEWNYRERKIRSDYSGGNVGIIFPAI